MLLMSTCKHGGVHVAEDGIDWSFFSMARYIATADPDGPRTGGGSSERYQGAGERP